MLRGSDIIIKEDLPKEVREDRKELGEVLMQLREGGKKGMLRGNKIYYGGKYYTKSELDDLKNDAGLLRNCVQNNKRQRSEDEQEDGQSKKDRADNRERNSTQELTAKTRQDKITNFLTGERQRGRNLSQ